MNSIKRRFGFAWMRFWPRFRPLTIFFAIALVIGLLGVFTGHYRPWMLFGNFVGDVGILGFLFLRKLIF